jgi:hypothetical protein
MHTHIRDVWKRPRVARAGRVTGGAVAVGAMIAMVAGVGTAAAAPAAASDPHKSYVCKYVSKPGENERLQTGQNPIWVDNHSLLGYDGTVTVGQEFKDGQFRSVVIVANTPKLDPEPSVADCPPVTPPTTPPTSTTTTSSTTSTTSTTTTSSTSSTGTHTMGTHTSPASTTTGSGSPVSTVTTYPLQPVNAGATSDPAGTASVTPVQVALLLLGVMGMMTLLFGRRLRFRRTGAPKA